MLSVELGDFSLASWYKFEDAYHEQTTYTGQERIIPGMWSPGFT